MHRVWMDNFWHECVILWIFRQFRCIIFFQMLKWNERTFILPHSVISSELCFLCSNESLSHLQQWNLWWMKLPRRSHFGKRSLSHDVTEHSECVFCMTEVFKKIRTICINRTQTKTISLFYLFCLSRHTYTFLSDENSVGFLQLWSHSMKCIKQNLTSHHSRFKITMWQGYRFIPHTTYPWLNYPCARHLP